MDTVKNDTLGVRCCAINNWEGFPQPPPLLHLDSLPPVPGSRDTPTGDTLARPCVAHTMGEVSIPGSPPMLEEQAIT